MDPQLSVFTNIQQNTPYVGKLLTDFIGLGEIESDYAYHTPSTLEVCLGKLFRPKGALFMTAKEEPWQFKGCWIKDEDEKVTGIFIVCYGNGGFDGFSVLEACKILEEGTVSSLRISDFDGMEGSGKVNLDLINFKNLERKNFKNSEKKNLEKNLKGLASYIPTQNMKECKTNPSYKFSLNFEGSEKVKEFFDRYQHMSPHIETPIYQT